MRIEKSYNKLEERSSRLKLIDGYHLTSTDKKNILYLLDNNIILDYIDQRITMNKVKSYRFDSLGSGLWEIEIGEYGTWTIGDVPKWQYDTVTVEYFG